MKKLDEQTLASIANRMLRDYDAKTPGSIFKGSLSISIEDAYHIQTAVTNLREQRGEKVIGLKIGCTCKNNQKIMGLSRPVCGRLWSTEKYASNSILYKTNFANVALEAEFAITLSRTLKPSQTSMSQLIASVETVHPVIEIHNLEMHGAQPYGAELIANNAIHAGVVVGKGINNLETSLTTNLSLQFDGKFVDSWNTLQWPNDILTGLKWLSKKYKETGQMLKKGDLILTGAFGPPLPLGDKKIVKVNSTAFGSVCATFI